MAITSTGLFWLKSAACLLVFSMPVAAQQSGTAKVVKVAVRIESEGPSGLWTQAGQDLTTAELNQLRNLVTARIEKLSNHKLVSADEKDDIVGLAVVAEKIQAGQVTYFLLSSVLTIARADGIDELVTHDVIAERSLSLAAEAVVGQLLSMELRAIVK